ncbi:MAG: A/G-specific adenine glycosylase [Pseudomonadota bacterium]|jgi:A/G-specific adenine glycosylase|nr:A/G-specific adenine glycosylase [Gammaproteobacteria bacterium]MBU1733334.1 A/G-specific adenine glycosylase [Gammaproteobacteria bacterium]MBU1892382.1 A/G-specific adenine glycosylase [Gammaproteobacteria bacterium]
MSEFAQQLICWHKLHGRHGLPWQGSRDPYAVWLSEIMLQQTQVSSVIPYYLRFLGRFPDIATLAAADQDEVLAHWSGLGYYSRARNLHRAAQIMAETHAAEFPREFEQILGLPGIGRSTASAIGAFSFGTRRAILDGNVKRVLARYLAVAGYPGEKKVADLLWRHAEDLLPETEIETYTQALMDLGATVCTRGKPNCGACPVSADCVAHQQGHQTEFPQPRPRKAQPEKATTMLLFMHQGEIFLEKRPPAGIWGGLWSFPEIAVSEDARQHAETCFGFESDQAEARPPMKHVFTHFRLNIKPLLINIRKIQPMARQQEGIWLTIEDAMEGAIPTPVRKLLAGLRKPPA